MSIETKKNSLLKLILFAFGFSQFFVKFEPGPPEIMTLALLPFIKWRALSHPASISLLIGNMISISLEAYFFGEVTWSLISIYLTICLIAVLSCIHQIGFDAFRSIISGGCFACAATLAALLITKSPDLYRYEIRFTGFFKDPNVTAPTALFFAVTALLLPGKQKILSAFPMIIFLISISRASYLAIGCAAILVASLGNTLRIYLAVTTVSILILLKDNIINLLNLFFLSIGRGSLINPYDNDRASNWNYLLTEWSEQLLPLGPTFSDRQNFAAHSTPLRLLVEQGLISAALFFFACYMAIMSKQPRILLAGLLALLINGIVIDATHWRVLFIAMAISIGAPYLTNQRTKISQPHKTKTLEISGRRPWATKTPKSCT